MLRMLPRIQSQRNTQQHDERAVSRGKAAFSVYGMIPLFVIDDAAIRCVAVSVSGTRMPRAIGSRSFVIDRSDSDLKAKPTREQAQRST
jgi:hypothetical protein